MQKFSPSPAARRWVYGVAVAVVPLLIAYGILQEEHAPLWVALIGAVFVPGMAWANTTSSHKDPPDEL